MTETAAAEQQSDRRRRAVTVTGPNRPMVLSTVVKTFADEGLAPTGINHMVVGDQLIFSLEVNESTAGATPGGGTAGGGAAAGGTVQGALDRLALGPEFTVSVSDAGVSGQRPVDRHRVTVFGDQLSSAGVAAITGRLAGAGGQLDRIQSLAANNAAYQLDVSGVDPATIRRIVRGLPEMDGIDVAVQPGAPSGRHLIVLDVDQTFIQNEVIELLAAEAGPEVEARVKEVTARAMRGELDFAESLHERVALLEGLDEGVFDRVYDKIKLTPGVAMMVMTAQANGDEIGLISGGFTQITDRLADEYGINRAYTAANTLEVVDGKLTGRVTGEVIDRAAKARKLQEFADRANIPMDRTIAIGDGANDLDMIQAAGVGIAFHAKPIVNAAAPATITPKDMRGVLYVRGVPQDRHARPNPTHPTTAPAAASTTSRPPHRPADRTAHQR
ncbi:phosphoserine phosphatase SerB [Kribbella solani]|uniref:phosphoserine phosphatase n=1 Tax=Kribbella solani TaxID=236067 RepID=A0A841DJA8_9ACTN|nr:phosphoserine phosphatase [Kribbella solani]